MDRVFLYRGFRMWLCRSPRLKKRTPMLAKSQDRTRSYSFFELFLCILGDMSYMGVRQDQTFTYFYHFASHSAAPQLILTALSTQDFFFQNWLKEKSVKNRGFHLR